MLPIIHNSKFEENSAGYGGACYIQYLRNGCSITDCTFINNDAINNGGDIRFHLDSDVNVNNCTFKGSRSNLNGGSIQANMVSNIKIPAAVNVNSTFSDIFFFLINSIINKRSFPPSNPGIGKRLVIPSETEITAIK